MTDEVLTKRLAEAEAGEAAADRHQAASRKRKASCEDDSSDAGTADKAALFEVRPPS